MRTCAGEKKKQWRQGKDGEINPKATTNFKNLKKSGFFFHQCLVKDWGASVMVHTMPFKPCLSLEQKFNTLYPRESSIVLKSLPNSDVLIRSVKQKDSNLLLKRKSPGYHSIP